MEDKQPIYRVRLNHKGNSSEIDGKLSLLKKDLNSYLGLTNISTEAQNSEAFVSFSESGIPNISGVEIFASQYGFDYRGFIRWREK